EITDLPLDRRELLEQLLGQQGIRLGPATRPRPAAEDALLAFAEDQVWFWSQLAAQVFDELAAPATDRDSRGLRTLLHEIQKLSDDQVRRLLETEAVPAGGALS